MKDNTVHLINDHSAEGDDNEPDYENLVSPDYAQ